MSTATKIEIRPIDFKKWHGKKGKESFTLPKTREVLLNTQTGKYETGLSEDESREYGRALGVDLSDRYVPGEPHAFWTEKASWLYLPNHPIYFDTKKPMDFVKAKNAKASKFVANSQKEYDEGFWPEATHVIYDEVSEVESRATKVQLRMKAMKAVEPLSADAKVQLVLIINNKIIKGRSNDFIDVEIDDIIQNNPSEIIKWIDKGRESVYIRSVIHEALHKGVLTKEGNGIYWMGEQIGIDIEDAQDWFGHPDNQIMKTRILEKLTS